MINEITKDMYPDIWDLILEDYYDIEKDHRKGSSFYCTLVYLIDEEFFPNHPELHGYWMTTEPLVWVDYYCLLDEGPTKLKRVEKKTRTITEEYWDIVKED